MALTGDLDVDGPAGSPAEISTVTVGPSLEVAITMAIISVPTLKG